MSKGIEKVRQSIIERQKARRKYLSDSEPNQRRPNLSQVQMEEKHGYFSDHLDYIHKETGQQKLFPGLMIKGVLSLMLFLGVFLLLKSNVSLLEKPKEWTSHALQEEFPFARVYQWYEETFGTPLAFSPQNHQEAVGQGDLSLPVSGHVTETFQVNGSGIMISPKEVVPVSAWHDGVIIFAGNDRDTDKTVVIQHADQSKTTYAHLSSLDVHLYQFISEGESIGTFNPTEAHETVYFSIEKDSEYIDPIQVINVDDIP